jgi:hypothetical protein
VVPAGTNKAVVFESRRAEGYDGGLTQAGVLAYEVDTGLSSQQGAIRVLPANAGDDHHLDAPMLPGSVRHVADFLVTVSASDADGDTLEVSRAPPDAVNASH